MWAEFFKNQDWKEESTKFKNKQQQKKNSSTSESAERPRKTLNLCMKHWTLKTKKLSHIFHFKLFFGYEETILNIQIAI